MARRPCFVPSSFCDCGWFRRDAVRFNASARRHSLIFSYSFRGFPTNIHRYSPPPLCPLHFPAGVHSGVGGGCGSLYLARRLSDGSLALFRRGAGVKRACNASPLAGHLLPPPTAAPTFPAVLPGFSVGWAEEVAASQPRCSIFWPRVHLRRVPSSFVRTARRPLLLPFPTRCHSPGVHGRSCLYGRLCAFVVELLRPRRHFGAASCGASRCHACSSLALAARVFRSGSSPVHSQSTMAA